MKNFRFSKYQELYNELPWAGCLSWAEETVPAGEFRSHFSHAGCGLVATRWKSEGNCSGTPDNLLPSMLRLPYPQDQRLLRTRGSGSWISGAASGYPTPFLKECSYLNSAQTQLSLCAFHIVSVGPPEFSLLSVSWEDHLTTIASPGDYTVKTGSFPICFICVWVLVEHCALVRFLLLWRYFIKENISLVLAYSWEV